MQKMADIDAYLKNILTAVYGEEVRGSIHDAIKAINETGAGNVKLNTKDNAGIVTKGQDSPDKVWATDSEGNPGWREYNFSKVLDASTWDSDKKGSAQYSRIIAKVKASKSAQGSSRRYKSVSFNAENTNIPNSFSEILWSTYNSGPTCPSFVYVGMQLHGDLSPNTFKNLESFFFYATTESEEKPDVYLALSALGDTIGNIIISNLRISPEIEEFEWLWDDNKYIDKAQLGTDGYEFYRYTSYNAYALQYDPIVSSEFPGLVPHLPVIPKNMLLNTNSYGTLGWRSISSLGFQTSAQVQEAISTAIASADFSSFEIVGSIPEPETAVENKFYLVKNEDTQHYDIYAKIGETVEWIDDTTVDLTNYTTLTDEQYQELDTMLETA